MAVNEPHSSAAIVTVGSELVSGLNLDTNTREIALALTAHDYSVVETTSVADDIDVLASTLARLCAAHAMVVVTGGLGPTHDDITREAAARALGVGFSRSPELVKLLEPWVLRHTEPDAASQIFRQADVLDGARVITAVKGTAPGQMIPTPRGMLVLLPGPPSEMRPMLDVLTEGRSRSAERRVLRCTRISESDAQVKASRVVDQYSGITLGVLASPSDVRIVLTDSGAGSTALANVADLTADEIGRACYSRDGSSLAAVVLGRADRTGMSIGTAESCTGGAISAEITSIPGSSVSFTGSVITYSNEMKTRLLGVSDETLKSWGAVSEQTARAMAQGARDRLGCDIALAVTGIAGPGGGTSDKPVGTVWFGIATPHDVRTELVHIRGDRDLVRRRATMIGLDLLRQALGGY